VDEQSPSGKLRLLCYLEQAIDVDARGRAAAVEVGCRYRSLREGKETLVQPLRLAFWLQDQALAEKAIDCAVAHTLPAQINQARQDQ